MRNLSRGVIDYRTTEFTESLTLKPLFVDVVQGLQSHSRYGNYLSVPVDTALGHDRAAQQLVCGLRENV